MTFDRVFEDEERVLGDVATYGRDALLVTAEAGLRPAHITDPAHRRIYEAAITVPEDWFGLVKRVSWQDAVLVIDLVDHDAPVFNAGVAADLAQRAVRIMNGGNEPRLRVPRILPPRIDDGFDRYGEVAFARITDDLRTASPGTRNKALNTAAFSAAKLVRDGHASEYAVSHLQGIALDLGLPPREVKTTWRSGWNAGWSS